MSTHWFKRKASKLFVLQQQAGLGSLRERSTFTDLGLSITGPMVKNEKEHGFIGTTLSKRRIFLFIFLAISTFFVFLFRAMFLQVIKGENYSLLAQGNRYRTERVVPARGIITDRYGSILAKNVPSFVLTMTIADLPTNEKERQDVFYKITQLSGLQRAELDMALTEFADRRYDPIAIARNISYETAIRLSIDLAGMDGFDLQASSKRAYDTSASSLSHILGYIGTISAEELADKSHGSSYRPIDTVGKIGIEKSAEVLLRGVPGEDTYEVDARGDNLAVVSQTDSIQGFDIALSIDLAFQKFVEEQTQITLDRVGATRAAVVAIDPRSGRVRALVSLPSYNNNDFSGGIDAQTYQQLLNDSDQPLFHRAISGTYPSGSTFKPFVAYAALAEGVVSEHTSFLSTGGLRINEWFFPDWKAGGHGITDIRKAIAESVNTYFYIVGGGFDKTIGLGVERITDYAKRFGFGNITGINLPGEKDGFLPSKEWKETVKKERWYVGDTYHLAIGQGDFLTTPIQMAVATSVIANGGTRYLPSLIESVNNEEVETRGEFINDLDRYALEIVRQGMRETVRSGSARSLLGLSKSVAAKTGTAQTPGDRPYHSWFTGFGPYDDPDLTLVVLIEEGGESNDAAVPLANRILWWWFTYGQSS